MMWRLGAVAVAALIVANDAMACAVCAGDPESNVVEGAEKAVILLGIVAYGVLMSMAFVGGTWIVRARRLDKAESSDSNDPETPA